MKNLFKIFIATVLAAAMAGCASPPTEPLPPGEKGAAITVLIESLQGDKSPTVRTAAALSLGQLRCRFADEALINAMYTDKAYTVKLAAIKSLGDMGGPKAEMALHNYSSKAPIPELAQAASAALNRLEQNRGKSK